jgi:hypothetical protein
LIEPSVHPCPPEFAHSHSEGLPKGYPKSAIGLVRWL